MSEIFIYILCGVIPCALIVIIAVFVTKKDNAKLEDLMKNVPEDAQNRLRSEPYSQQNGKMYTTNGFVADIREEKGRAVVYLIFYNTPREQFYDQRAKMSSDELKAKGIQKNTFIPCLMKHDAEYHIFEFKKLM